MIAGTRAWVHALVPAILLPGLALAQSSSSVPQAVDAGADKVLKRLAMPGYAHAGSSAEVPGL